MAPRLLLALGAAAALLSTLPTPVLATKYVTQQFSRYRNYYPEADEYCFYGCNTAVTFITFNVVPASADPEAYYLNQCSNTQALKSNYYCAQKYCTPEEAQAGRDKLSLSCEKNVGFGLASVAEYTLTPEQLANVPTLNETAALATATNPLNTTAIPDADFFQLGYQTEKDFYITWDLGFTFSLALIGFWGFVVLVGMVHRVLTFVKTPSGSKNSSLWLWIRRTLILPATFGKHQAEAIVATGTIPPRLESIILGLYLIMNIVFCFPAYNLFAGNLYYATNKLQLARYVADRTGFLSIAQLPMVWIFAARNDPFMWLTGWSVAVFNRFHRWIARISVLHAVIHSIAYTVFDFYSPTPGGYAASWKEEYWYCGGIATVVMCLMLGASAYYFRERWYDLFLMVHIGMSIIFFVTLWYHVRIFDGEFNYYLYPCIAIWGLDRLLRIGRTVFVSLMPRFTKGVKATATYHRTTELVRMDITDFFPQKQIVPGQYYYLYMPGGLRGYESHPMTLCSWNHPGPSLPPSPTRTPDFNKEIESTVRRVSEDTSETSKPAHSFLIRPYNGMTGRLQKKLLSAAAEENVAVTQETIFLEGPYGEKLDLSCYSDVLVICGGSGITAAISHAHFLLSANTHTRVHISWAVPQRHLPDDICANELASVMDSDRLKMTVYLTSAAEEEANHDPEKHLPAAPPYAIRTGRPDVEAIMRQQRQEASNCLAVVTCGTPQMSDTCRAAVVKVLGEEGVEVGYYNETLVW